MSRAKWLQETRPMRFEDVYEKWSVKRCDWHDRQLAGESPACAVSSREKTALALFTLHH